MHDRFTLFIDESGEAGIEKIRSASSRGASPYMTFGASLIQNESRKSIEEALQNIRSDIGKKTLHCSHLNHYQLLHFAREITRQKMRLFGLISRKETLGKYRSDIANDSNMYYNKCTQYLLERVGYFMECQKIAPENLEIIFEKANQNYRSMLNLLEKCQSNPLHKNTRLLKNIDLTKIKVKSKSEEPLLQLADLVSHALYRCVDKAENNHNITESRYLRELSPIFFGNPDTNMIEGAGLYCVHSINDLNLDLDVKENIKNMRSPPLN